MRRVSCGAPDRRDQRGSGIVENLMALGLFSSGMVAVGALTGEVLFTNELASEYAAATTLARNVFEDIRTRDPEERTALGIDDGSLSSLNSAGETVPGGRYQVSWEIFEETPHAGMEMVAVHVKWHDSRGRERTYHFHSGFRKGWPAPVVIPETQADHGHGQGHDDKTSASGKGCKT